jgi:hypothetical protein
MNQQQLDAVVSEFLQASHDREGMAEWLSHIDDRVIEHNLADGALDAMDIEGEEIWQAFDDEHTPDIWFELVAHRSFMALAKQHGLFCTWAVGRVPSAVPEWVSNELDETLNALLDADTTCAVSAACFDVIRKAEAMLDVLRDVDSAQSDLGAMVARQCEVFYYG